MTPHAHKSSRKADFSNQNIIINYLKISKESYNDVMIPYC